MKTMKFSMKVLMAMLMFCLPLAFTSCGDDDDEPKGPATYSYSYSITYANADPQDVIAVQTVYDTALKTVGTIEGTDLSKKTVKVTAKSESETKEQVNLRVKGALLAAETAMTTTELIGKNKITVKVSGNGINESKKY